MKRYFTAGRFEVSTVGWPGHIEIKQDGKSIADRINPADLKDLIFTLERMRASLRYDMGIHAYELD